MGKYIRLILVPLDQVKVQNIDTKLECGWNRLNYPHETHT